MAAVLVSHDSRDGLFVAASYASPWLVQLKDARKS